MKGGGKRILNNINVLGSTGSIRFVVNEETVVAAVIETALKAYARESRLPVLGTKCTDFFLYTPIAGTQALNALDIIGSFGVRNFMLCKKPQEEVTEMSTRKSHVSWKSLFNKSVTLKVTPCYIDDVLLFELKLVN
ncbi:hypothetical protein R6Q57_024714 [Mikania cordata]